jgi:hypothetical protein
MPKPRGGNATGVYQGHDWIAEIAHSPWGEYRVYAIKRSFPFGGADLPLWMQEIEKNRYRQHGEAVREARRIARYRGA